MKQLLVTAWLALWCSRWPQMTSPQAPSTCQDRLEDRYFLQMWRFGIVYLPFLISICSFTYRWIWIFRLMRVIYAIWEGWSKKWRASWGTRWIRYVCNLKTLHPSLICNFINTEYEWNTLCHFQVYFGKTKEMICTLRPPSELVQTSLPEQINKRHSWNICTRFCYSCFLAPAAVLRVMFCLSCYSYLNSFVLKMLVSVV